MIHPKISVWRSPKKLELVFYIDLLVTGAMNGFKLKGNEEWIIASLMSWWPLNYS